MTSHRVWKGFETSLQGCFDHFRMNGFENRRPRSQFYSLAGGGSVQMIETLKLVRKRWNWWRATSVPCLTPKKRGFSAGCDADAPRAENSTTLLLPNLSINCFVGVGDVSKIHPFVLAHPQQKHNHLKIWKCCRKIDSKLCAYCDKALHLHAQAIFLHFTLFCCI
jgi:hypothetical protein